MSEAKIYMMGDEDLLTFEQLTCQESVTVEGQIKKMEMIETMIRERDEKFRRSSILKLRLEQRLAGVPLAAAMAKEVQNIRITQQQLGDGRFNLMIEKGDDDPDNDDTSIYRVMIPAHIDTVDMGAPTELLHDPRNPDRASGQGVYDMGGAVLNNIDLAISTRVPNGMKAYFVFTVDEETNSIGARELIRQWEIWPMIDVVVSSEIGPVPPLPDGDLRARLITARAGRIKFIGNINVDNRMQGHGSETDMPNASRALRSFLQSLDNRFYSGYENEVSHAREHKQQRTHELLGEEMIEDGDIAAWKTKKGYVPPDKGEYQFAVKMVPPSTRTEYTNHFLRWARGITKAARWPDYGINNTISVNPNLACYSPYEIPKDDPIVQVAISVMTRITGVAAEIVGAPSVADECDYAEAGKTVITLPIKGDEAHHPDEWTSLSDVLRVRDMVRGLLEDEDGFRKLMDEKQK